MSHFFIKPRNNIIKSFFPESEKHCDVGISVLQQSRKVKSQKVKRHFGEFLSSFLPFQKNPEKSKNDSPRDDGMLQRVLFLVLLLGVTASASASIRIRQHALMSLSKSEEEKKWPAAADV